MCLTVLGPQYMLYIRRLTSYLAARTQSTHTTGRRIQPSPRGRGAAAGVSELLA